MNIDRVAKRMTAPEGPRGWRGPSGPAFTARVMAPIEGRPSPGFTSRVMQGIDAPSVGRSFSSGFTRALILIPTAIALAAGTFILTRGSARMPAVPGAPRLATNDARVRMPDAPPPADGAVRVVRASRAPISSISPTAPLPEPSPIYQIAALEGPAVIIAKDIQPAACTIPALEGPAPLKVPDLPANTGGSDKQFKEQP